MTDILQVKINEFTNNVLKQQLNNFGEAGKKAVKEIRTELVDMWFGEFNSLSVNVATRYRQYTRLFNNNTAEVKILSFIDIDRYNPKPKAEIWRKKYGGSTDSKEYVLFLQLYQGIIGLPEKSNARPDSKWVNRNFHQQIPMLTFVENSNLWNEFSGLVHKYTKY